MPDPKTSLLLLRFATIPVFRIFPEGQMFPVGRTFIAGEVAVWPEYISGPGADPESDLV